MYTIDIFHFLSCMFRSEIKCIVCDEKPFYILKEKKLVLKAF